MSRLLAVAALLFAFPAQAVVTIDFDSLAHLEVVTNQFPELTFTGGSFPV